MVSGAARGMKPALLLRVGITGHLPTRLKPERVPEIERQLVAVLALMQTSLATIRDRQSPAFAAEVSRVVLVSPLAAGADSLAAEAALAAGAELEATLPFAPAAYREDFSGADANRFDRLLAASRRVLTLPGDRAAQEDAYHAVGSLNANQCDILLAVWDGKPAAGIGGTAHIIADAVASSLPVIVIDAAGKGAPVLLWNAADSEPHDNPTVESVARRPALDALPAAITALFAPPDDAGDLLTSLAAAHRPRSRAIAYPLLLTLTGARTLRAAFRRQTLGDSEAQMTPVLACFEEGGACLANSRERLVPRFAAADLAANRFAALYRGGFVGNFAMAALAVAFALAGVLAPKLKVAFVILELLTILAIILRTRLATRAGWHRRWIDCRHLAEILRVLPLSAALGDLSLLRHVELEEGGAPAWYARATAREIGLCEGAVDAGRVAAVRTQALALVRDQIGYHAANAERMEKMDHGIRRAGEVLFVITLGACVGWIAASAMGEAHAYVLGMDLTSLVTVLTALLPAAGGALYGIRMQGDFAGSAERSRAIRSRLVRLANAIERDPPDYRRLTSRLRRLTEIMLAEVDQWRQLSEVRPLELPG